MGSNETLRAILMFNYEGQGHKTASTNHNHNCVFGSANQYIPHTKVVKPSASPNVDPCALFCLRSLYAKWPSPSSPTETLSGLIQVMPQNISFPQN